MNLTIELSDQKAAALRAQAAARGLTVERWVEQIAEQHAETYSDSAAGHRKTDLREQARAFERWARNHPRRMPLPEDAFRRENMIRDAK